MVSPRRSRRLTSIAAVAAAAALVLCSCAGGVGGESGADEEVNLRFAFWGSDTRVRNTEEIIEAFNEDHPEINVEVAYSDWDNFWDQLNTQIAGGDAPDIFQMDAPYLREYGERGALMDLSGVDLSAIPEEIVESGTIDGEYYGLASGVNAVAIVANPAVFEAAGVPLPDDSSWTWEDYSEIAQEISGNLDGVYGAAGPAEPQLVQVFMRQHGLFVTNDEGELGFEEADLRDYFRWLHELAESGVFPEAQMMVEEESTTQDQSLEATGQAAMALTWTNLLGALTDAGGEELTLLRLPSQTGSVEEAAQWYNTGMISASGHTEHPDAVVTFLDFFVNDERSAVINMTDRGLSANTEIRDLLIEEMDAANQEAAEFITDIERELGPPEPVPATGFGQIGEVLTRFEHEMFFERMTAEQAAAGAYAELEGVIGD